MMSWTTSGVHIIFPERDTVQGQNEIHHGQPVYDETVFCFEDKDVVVFGFTVPRAAKGGRVRLISPSSSSLAEVLMATLAMNCVVAVILLPFASSFAVDSPTHH